MASAPSWAARQLEEVESLRAIFAEEDELHADAMALSGLAQLVSSEAGGSAEDPAAAAAAAVSVSIRLRDEAGASAGVRLAAVLPWGYPSGCDTAACSPVVWLEPEGGAASAEVVGDDEICSELQAQADTLAQAGEECLFGLVQFAEDLVRHRLQQAAAVACAGATDVEEQDELLARALLQEELEFASAAPSLQGPPRLGRRAMFSHHIIAPSKRQVIAEWARQLHLGGLAKIGWPGLIIVEGDERDVRTYVEALSRLRWKHFVVRGEQVVDGHAGQILDDLRALPLEFVEFGTDGMSDFAARCRQFGLEDLFCVAMKIGTSGASGGNKQGPRSAPASQRSLQQQEQQQQQQQRRKGRKP